MQKPNGFDTARARQFTGRPKTGYYVFHIIKMTEEQTKAKEGKEPQPMMVLLLDIAEGKYAGYFRKKLDWDRRKDLERAKFKGVYRRLTNHLEEFKADTEMIEASNPGFKFLFDGTDENLIRGKLIGGAIGEEEYNSNGDTTIKINYLMTVKDARIANANNTEPPKLKKFKGVNGQGWSGDPNEPTPDYTGDPGPQEDLPF